MTGFTHIIAFKYKNDVAEDEIREFEQTFLGLETNCVKDDGKPYLKVRGGKQVMSHLPAHSMESVFIVDFQTKEDEQYFHNHDKTHGAFIPKAQEISVDVVILDFAPF